MAAKNPPKKTFWSAFIPVSWSVLREGYAFGDFKKDLIAGMTVGLVALPLAIAFAIASGVSPEQGICTAIVAGFLMALLGGSRFQIGGPTGAFVVIIYAIMQRQGYEGLVFVTLLAGAFLLIAAFSRLGNLIKYIPYPLVTGFTTGIAAIVFSSQMKDFFGLKMGEVPAEFIPKWGALFSALPTFDPTTLLVSLGTLGLIIFIRRVAPVIPWGIASVAMATLVTWGFDLPIDTIESRFGELSRSFPFPSLPKFSLSFAAWPDLFSDAFTIAFLAGVESLLSAVVADGMAGTRHKSNCELLAQGVANIGSVIFGGIPATGAIARTATNVKAGARTPVAGMIHAITLLLILLIFAPVVSKIPFAALAAVLVMVAWNMSELEHFRHLFRAPLGDVAVLLSTFLLTMLVDLTVAVEVGMVLASFLFMKRIGTISGIISILEKGEASGEGDLREMMQIKPPQGTEIYEIQGPFLFGIADSLRDILSNLELPPKVFILRMKSVPIIDASGMHALREFYYKCQRQRTTLLLSEVQPKVHHELKRFGIVKLIGEKAFFPQIGHAIKSVNPLF